ncbi:MAG TPA: hypothetical protein VLA74_13720 [Nitrososphaeraceae archaeon]|nr:hypothetical protein [Nitrososphaeraceae archaeon]
MIIKLIIILALTFVVVTMIAGQIFINSDSVYGATSKSIAKGGLVNIQNDQNGIPTWIIHGIYRMDEMNSTSPMFNATFYMMKLNGSAAHIHTISNFKLIGSPIINNNSTTFNGTATITMENGPITDVPISIKLMSGHAISVWLDPLKIDKHLGNTLIYGSQHLHCVERPQYCK